MFKRLLNEQEFGELECKDESVKEMTFAEATRFAALPDFGADLENKVVLSIAVRLAAEEFAIAKIDDDEWIAGLSSNQMAKLINR
ncbi:MAG: hypothetical protein ABJQ70_09325 [Roseobacter sp.]